MIELDNDPRIGKHAYYDHYLVLIQKVFQHPDGYEVFQLEVTSKLTVECRREELQIIGEDITWQDITGQK